MELLYECCDHCIDDLGGNHEEGHDDCCEYGCNGETCPNLCGDTWANCDGSCQEG